MTKTSKANSASAKKSTDRSGRRSAPAARMLVSADRPKVTKRSSAETDRSAKRDSKPRPRRGAGSSEKSALNDRTSKAIKLGTKAATVIEMLQSPDGALLEELMDATGWQAHSVRGFLSGTLKKKHSFTIVSEKHDGVRRYRIPA